RSSTTKHEHADHSHGETGARPGTCKDPVCGMSVHPDKAAGRSEFAGKTWYFCSLGCKKRFDASPESFAAPEPDCCHPAASGHTPAVKAGGSPGHAPAKPGASGNVSDSGSYTCPMHPEIIRDKPGSCPLCGMALEPRKIGRAHV